MITDDFTTIEATLKQAMADAKIKPGRYGGRYVSRRFDKATKRDVYEVMKNDDPRTKDAQNINIDILAQVMPTKVIPIGRARYWINQDGTINREYFGEQYAATPEAIGG